MEEGRAVAIAVDGDQQARVGPEHLSTLMSMNDIKVARSEKSCFAADGTMYQTLQPVIGPGHPNTLSSKSTLDEWHGVNDSSAPQLSKAPVVIQGNQTAQQTPTGASLEGSRTSHGRKQRILSCVLFFRRN